jgi:hypothetical protein
MDERKPLSTYRKIVRPILVIVNKRIVFRRYIKHFHVMIKAQRLGRRHKYSTKLIKENSAYSRIGMAQNYIE